MCIYDAIVCKLTKSSGYWMVRLMGLYSNKVRGYVRVYASDERNGIKMSVNFSPETCIMGEWKVSLE